MLTGLVQHINKAKFLLENHSTTILTGVGVGGTVATAVLTGRASFRAAQLIEDEQRAIYAIWQEGQSDLPPGPLPKSKKVKLTWMLYLPPVAAGAVTITSIIVANKITSKKIAALAVAGGISERALQEYKEKVVEKLGERQNQKIRDEIAQDRVTNHPLGSTEIILAGTGDVLCYDMLTGRYFQSNVESIKSAENKLNHDMLNHMGASLAEFHDLVGLPATPYTDSVGWSGPDLVKVHFSTTMSQDQRPCVAIDFDRPPVLEWSKMY
jgi:hypothetical protein